MAMNVKKGDTVIFFDGETARIEDNKKGMIRSICMPMLGDPSMMDYGSAYVTDFEFAIHSGIKYRILHTEEQKHLAKVISVALGDE